MEFRTRQQSFPGNQCRKDIWRVARTCFFEIKRQKIGWHNFESLTSFSIFDIYKTYLYIYLFILYWNILKIYSSNSNISSSLLPRSGHYSSCRCWVQGATPLGETRRTSCSPFGTRAMTEPERERNRLKELEGFEGTELPDGEIEIFLEGTYVCVFSACHQLPQVWAANHPAIDLPASLSW